MPNFPDRPSGNVKQDIRVLFDRVRRLTSNTSTSSITQIITESAVEGSIGDYVKLTWGSYEIILRVNKTTGEFEIWRDGVLRGSF